MKTTSYIKSLKCQHNSGTHYTSGKYCSDCGRFIHKGTLEHFMCCGWIDVSMCLHNRRVYFHRGETKSDIAPELKKLDKSLNSRFISNLSENEAIDFKNETYRLLHKYGILDTESTRTLHLQP